MGLFIAFEGGEGSGKTTQAQALLRKLRRRGYNALLLQEPGGTPLGRILRQLLTSPRGGLVYKRDKQFLVAALGETTESVLLPLASEAELFLFAASRAQLVAELIQPALEEQRIVLCDRYTASTLAYQGYGRSLDLGALTVVNRLATRGLTPDLTILLDIDPKEGLARSQKRAPTDRFEQEELAFHERVRQGYLTLAKEGGGHWVTLDASLPSRTLSKMIWEKVQGWLARSRIQPKETRKRQRASQAVERRLLL